MASFNNLYDNDKVSYTKKEFMALIKNIFENPEVLKTYINEKKLSDDEAKIILKVIDTCNTQTCECCRKFDASRLKISPVPLELEPLLSLAQNNVKSKSY